MKKRVIGLEVKAGAGRQDWGADQGTAKSFRDIPAGALQEYLQSIVYKQD
ncbi:hypothetical protein [Rossellomorea sp. KS-H15a]|nr:hypothetical protein [Rossellomorea sp. KS-H15a]UTE78290.1 hypothetical protein M1J35_05855 [Rossellomorea sp. KS-H15a]